jgi:hypothetical protein
LVDLKGVSTAYALGRRECELGRKENELRECELGRKENELRESGLVRKENELRGNGCAS